MNQSKYLNETNVLDKKQFHRQDDPSMAKPGQRMNGAGFHAGPMAGKLPCTSLPVLLCPLPVSCPAPSKQHMNQVLLCSPHGHVEHTMVCCPWQGERFTSAYHGMLPWEGERFTSDTSVTLLRGRCVTHSLALFSLPVPDRAGLMCLLHRGQVEYTDTPRVPDPPAICGIQGIRGDQGSLITQILLDLPPDPSQICHTLIRGGCGTSATPRLR